MTGSRLAALLDQFDADHWGPEGLGPVLNAQKTLLTLAPDLARLVIQAVARHPEDKWLLAKFAALDEKAGTA